MIAKKFLHAAGYVLAGVLGFGAALDAVSNSIALFTISRATNFTVVLLTGALVVSTILRWRPLAFSDLVAIKSVGPKPKYMLAGVTALVWAGAYCNNASSTSSATTQPSNMSANTTIASGGGAPGPLRPLPFRFDNERSPISVELRDGLDPGHGVTTLTPYFKGSLPGRGLEMINVKVDALRHQAVEKFLNGQREQSAFRQKEGIEEPPFGSEGIHFERRCRPRLISRTLISILCLDESYGGFPQAHNAQETSSLNFELDDATARAFGLSDILVRGSYAGHELERLVRQQAIEQGSDEAWLEGEGLYEAMDQGFGLVKDGLAFHLGEYSTGPYVEGAREVVVPYVRLGGILRSDGPLATVDSR